MNARERERERVCVCVGACVKDTERENEVLQMSVVQSRKE